VPPTPDPTGHDIPNGLGGQRTDGWRSGWRSGRRTGRDVARTRGPLLVAAVLVVAAAGLAQRDTDRVALAVLLLGVQLLGLLGLTLLAVDAATLRKAHHDRERHRRDPVDRRP